MRIQLKLIGKTLASWIASDKLIERFMGLTIIVLPADLTIRRVYDGQDMLEAVVRKSI